MKRGQGRLSERWAQLGGEEGGSPSQSALEPNRLLPSGRGAPTPLGLYSSRFQSTRAFLSDKTGARRVSNDGASVGGRNEKVHASLGEHAAGQDRCEDGAYASLKVIGQGRGHARASVLQGPYPLKLLGSLCCHGCGRGG